MMKKVNWVKRRITYICSLISKHFGIAFYFKLICLNLNVNVECIPGYRGLDCSSECPYPSYGRKCDGICNCSKIHCDVSTGCNTITTGKEGPDIQY